MNMLEDTKDMGVWVAKLVATTIICALMYKGMSIFAHDQVQSETSSKTTSPSLYMTMQANK